MRELNAEPRKSIQHRRAALEMHAKHDPRKTTAKARAASPGQLAYWEPRVDPDGVLSPVERARRAECARRAHFLNMSERSAAKRRAHREAPEGRTSQSPRPGAFFRYQSSARCLRPEAP